MLFSEERLESVSIQAPDLCNDPSNLDFTSDIHRSPDVEPDSIISGPTQPQTEPKTKRMFSFSTFRNIFQRPSVSSSLLVTCHWLEKW